MIKGKLNCPGVIERAPCDGFQLVPRVDQRHPSLPIEEGSFHRSFIRQVELGLDFLVPRGSGSLKE
jgi:hypothetical protein